MKTIEFHPNGKHLLVGDSPFSELECYVKKILLCEGVFREVFPHCGETVYIDIQNHWQEGFIEIPQPAHETVAGVSINGRFYWLFVSVNKLIHAYCKHHGELWIRVR